MKAYFDGIIDLADNGLKVVKGSSDGGMSLEEIFHQIRELAIDGIEALDENSEAEDD